MIRPHIEGKFLFIGEEKFYVRGVTYGAFRPDTEGREYQDFERIETDFAQMALAGMNAVRIPHTTPPREVLDIAGRHGLRVMVGLSAEHYIGYLVDRKGAPDVRDIIRKKVQICAGHPALLCYALGNELSASLVRWLGRTRVERYLRQLHDVVREEDRQSIVTYVNYPTTEYLQLPFLDVLSFNVYLESQDRFEAYLARLQNLAGDRPLLMSETGLDSLRNGEEEQAQMLEWQVRSAFASGCAGTFIFAWTDEWHRDGEAVDDWEFGLTDRERNPKPALEAVQGAFAEVPFPPGTQWPSVSVIVCSYNGNRTLPETLAALARLDYPDYEVIVVDDGSRDRLAPMVEPYDFRLIRTENRGLSRARNAGLEAATGDIVAYLDDDAWPDPHWLQYLASTFQGTEHLAVGGPNVAPANGIDVADCVANAPGGPIHVLISDNVAEHLPGCNLAVRREALENLGGFDPQFHVAGDDVDLCWRLRQHGSIGFHAGAMVWHRRRDSIRGYWKQQCGYGAAEAMLEKKWPEKYNAPGHLTWEGRIYCHGTSHWSGRVGRIYHGVWGSAPFQRIYRASASGLLALPMLPEWHLVVLLLVALSALSLLWTPLVIAAPLLVAALAVVVVPAGLSAARASFPDREISLARQLILRTITAALHLIQPVARLWGRLQRGLSPWRKRGAARVAFPWRRQHRLWRDLWKSPDQRLQSIEETLRQEHPGAFHGGEFDRWDIEVRAGLLGGARMILSTEDYAGGQQLVRVRSWPIYPLQAVILILFLGGLASWAGIEDAWAACVALGTVTGVLALRMFFEGGTGLGAIVGAVEQTNGGEL